MLPLMPDLEVTVMSLQRALANVATPTEPQFVWHGRLNRSFHVFYKKKGGRYDGYHKCVICGGLTQRPTVAGDCETFEPLTPEERAMCPNAA